MKIVIDAWLERKDPQIRFIDGDNASVLLQLGSDITRQMLEYGEISVEELQTQFNNDLIVRVFGMLEMPLANGMF